MDVRVIGRKLEQLLADVFFRLLFSPAAYNQRCVTGIRGVEEYMSPEQAFEIVTNGLASQQWEKSWDPVSGGMACKLRSTDGKRCAIGWLISDEEYMPIMDTWEVQWPLPDISQDLLNDMRKGHDHSFSPRDMWSCFSRIAEKYRFPFTHPAPKVEW